MLTPNPASTLSAVSRVLLAALELGAHVYFTTPVQHDDMVARVSHLPHLLAAVIGLVSTTHDSAILAAGSFRDTTRILDSPPARTAEFLGENSEAVLRVLDEASQAIVRLIQAETDGAPALAGVFQDAQLSREVYLSANDAEPRAVTYVEAADVADLVALGGRRLFVTSAALSTSRDTVQLTCQRR